jgi:hypothetical protein
VVGAPFVGVNRDFGRERTRVFVVGIVLPDATFFVTRRVGPDEFGRNKNNRGTSNFRPFQDVIRFRNHPMHILTNHDHWEVQEFDIGIPVEAADGTSTNLV